MLAEVSYDEAKMRERKETLSFLSFLPRRERPPLARRWWVGCFGFVVKDSHKSVRAFHLDHY